MPVTTVLDLYEYENFQAEYEETITELNRPDESR